MSVSLQPTPVGETRDRLRMLRAHALIAADALEEMGVPWAAKMRAEILRRLADCEAARMERLGGYE